MRVFFLLAQHKKKKKSYKSYDTKEVGDDILSAFVDKPKVEEIPETIKEVKKDFEMQPEELTWENKVVLNFSGIKITEL